jgi:aminoglycoside phosphotransferase
MTLRLTDGTTITDLTRPNQGMRHRVLFGVEEASGREVAVKIELIAGALEPERRTLEWLTRQDGPSPRLHVAGTLDASGEYSGAVCLVIDRVAGENPDTPASWGRLGRALARLSRVPWRGSDLTTLDHDAFLALHERRVDDLGRALGRDLAAMLPAVPPSYSTLALVVTHGDPGPGNFLDDGAGPEGHIARPGWARLVAWRRRRPVRPPPSGARRRTRRPALGRCSDDPRISTCGSARPDQPDPMRPLKVIEWLRARAEDAWALLHSDPDFKRPKRDRRNGL